MKLTTKPKASNFVNLQVWRHTKTRLARTAKKRKQGLAEYVDQLSNITSDKINLE